MDVDAAFAAVAVPFVFGTGGLAIAPGDAIGGDGRATPFKAASNAWGVKVVLGAGEAAAGAGDVIVPGGPDFVGMAVDATDVGFVVGDCVATGFAGAGRGVVFAEAVVLAGMAPAGITPVARICAAVVIFAPAPTCRRYCNSATAFGVSGVEALLGFPAVAANWAMTRTVSAGGWAAGEPDLEAGVEPDLAANC